MSAAFWMQIKQGLVWESDILTLLPVTEQDPVAEEAVTAFTRRIGKKTIFLIGHQDQEQARLAATDYAAELAASTYFENVVFDTASLGEKAFFDLYFPHRFWLLSAASRTLLQADQGGQVMVRRAAELLYSPMTAAVSGYLEDDPLMLFPEFLKGFPKPPSKLEISDGKMLVRGEDMPYFLITADLVGSAFSGDIQTEVIGQLEGQKQALNSQFPEANLLSTGVIYYAHAGAASAKREISTIGLGSVMGILVLLIAAFRSLRPLLMSLLPIGVGCLTALCLCFWWFGELHLLTLVFGASLIGVCIDYSFHFFCECYYGPGNWNPQRAMRHILPGISLGALTSMLGYMGLLLAPFPGLKQMAVFSSAGLLGAFATVVFWFPFLASLGASRKTRQSHGIRIVSRYIGWWRQRHMPTVLALLALPALGAMWVMVNLQANDDIRLLQAQPQALVTQEQQIRDWIGGVDTSRFFLIEGKDEETMLQHGEALQISLEQALASDKLGFFQGLHQWVPSQQRQLQNRDLLREKLLPNQVLANYLNEMGFEEDRLALLNQAWTQADPPLLELVHWFESAASAPFRHLWLGETSRGVASMLLLGGVGDEALMETIANKHEGVTYIDKVSDVSQLFARYRILASKLVLLAYAVILLLLFFRYGFQTGLRVIAPPMLAAAFALALTAAFGLTVNLFTMLALLLVLGIGIDYTIFLAESGEDTTMMAIVLSSITTILSFGLLALSETPVLQSFGLTLLLGIAMAMLLSPLVVCGRDPRETEVAR